MWKTNIYQLIFCLCFKHGLLTSNQRIGGGVRNVLMWPVQKNYERRGLYWVACRPQLFQTEMEQNGAILSGIYSIPTNLSLTLSSISGWIEVGKLTTICIELGGHSVKTSHLIFSDAGCWEEEYEPVLCPPIRNALGDALKDERWYSWSPMVIIVCVLKCVPWGHTQYPGRKWQNKSERIALLQVFNYTKPEGRKLSCLRIASFV